MGMHSAGALTSSSDIESEACKMNSRGAMCE